MLLSLPPPRPPPFRSLPIEGARDPPSSIVFMQVVHNPSYYSVSRIHPANALNVTKSYRSAEAHDISNVLKVINIHRALCFSAACFPFSKIVPFL